MGYKTISPLGKREGPGTFDAFYDTQKYKNIEDASAAHDYVKVDFVMDDAGTIFFEFTHSQHPEEVLYKRLDIQHFPFGIDMLDDQMACDTAYRLLEKHSI